MAGNQYYVEPANLGGLLAGVGSVLKSTRKRKMQQTLMDAYQSRDPNQVAKVMAKNPEAGKQLESMMDFRDKQSKRVFLETTRNALSSPDNAVEYLQGRVEYLEGRGMDTTNAVKALDIYQQDPEAAKNVMEMTYAQLAPKQEWEAYKNQQGMGKDFFKQQEIDFKRETLNLRKSENDLRRDEQLLSRETNQLKRDELKLKIEEKRSNIDAKQEKLSLKKTDLGKKAVANMAATNDTIKSINDFMENQDYIDSMAGYSGRLPTLTTGGTDAESAFNNIKNNLTLENLGKMTGVLSETDIKILSNAASRLEPGMSEKAMLKEMNRIKKFLNRRAKKFKGDAAMAGIDLTKKTEIKQPQDVNAQALEWAKSNPDDPRAAQIMQKLGVQ